MKHKKDFLTSFSYSAFANGINLLVSILSAFIVPKVLGVSEYSYWQLYTFYTSYVGFFHFGWADGIYLKQGGKRYQDLDKQNMANQFRLYVLFELLIAILIILLSWILVEDKGRLYVLVCTAVCLFITLSRTFLQYLLQTTDRISEYAQNIIYEKIIYVIGVFIALFLGVRSYEPLLIIDLFAKLVTFFVLARLCRDILTTRITHIFRGIKEAWDNVRIGSRLMIANIAGLLITGIVKMAVEQNWGIETFGKVSLTMTASNMIMVFISAVSVVLYPMLKNVQEESLVPIYRKLRSLLMLLTLGMLIFYYPMRVVISYWLPQYADSLKYMALLFPMCVFESKTAMLSNTYFKALRKEKQMMAVNWISVLFTLVFTGTAVYVLHDLTLTMLGLTLSLGFKSTLAEAVLSRYVAIKIRKELLIEWGMLAAFCFLSWSVGGWIGELGYIILYLIYAFLNLDFLKGIKGKL